jgi:hypothetical protein
LKITVNEFKENFRTEYDEIECAYSLKHYKSNETGCSDLIFKSADILKTIIDKYVK